MHQLHAWWRIDDEGWQEIENKNLMVIFGHKAIHMNFSFTRSRKSKDVDIVGAESNL